MRNMTRRDFIKASSSLMVVGALSSMSLSAYATAPMQNELEILYEEASDTSAYMEYYITISGEKRLYKEHLQIADDLATVKSTSVKVDDANMAIAGTQKCETITRIIPTIKENKTGARSGFSGWRAYESPISMKDTKMTLAAISLALTVFNKMPVSVADKAAAAILKFFVDKACKKIPDNIYFKGETGVSHSVGKIYNRYQGNIYLEQSHSTLLASNLSWSSRWGH